MSQPDNGAPTGGQPQLLINAQYIKDLSFESPNAPQSMLPREQPPQIEVNVDVQGKGVADDMFEVALIVRAKAQADEQALFMIELIYCGLFTIRNVPQEQLEPICLIECPRLIFPFARRIVADAVRDGGFPPLMLEPIDFLQLYTRHRQGGQAAAVPSTTN